MSKDPTGWMAGVAKIPTNSWGYDGFAEDGMYPQALTCHVAQGYFSGLLGIARASQPGKSWHFSVGRDGSIAQHVSIWDPAYHAGVVNNPQLYAAELIGRFGGNPNKWSVGIEMEGFSVDPGYGFDYLYSTERPWPDAQFESVVRIHRWVWQSCQWLTDLSGAERAKRLLTHSMIDQRTRKQDPGDLWLATRRLQLIEAMAPAPPVAPLDLLGVKADIETAQQMLAAALKKLGG